MALTQGAFPYDINNLLGGAVRVLYGKTSGVGAAAVPTSIADVVSMVHPYAAATNWTDLGATRDAFSYGRGFASEGYEIQQVRGNVIEEITDITRTIEVSVADFRPEHLAMMEGSPTVGTVPGGTGEGTQKRVGFGSFASLDQYRFAFVAMRPKQAGVVIEPGGRTRGRFFMGVAYMAQLSADDVSLEFDKGTLTAAGVTFALFPDGTEDAGEEFGAWYDEDAQTIA